jgi:hypothetical protein
MSRARSRARRRRAHFEQRIGEFSRARDNPLALREHLRRLLDSDIAIWPIAEASSLIKPLDDDERALITQEVGPHLIGKPPGTVRMGRRIEGEREDSERKRREEEDRRLWLAEKAERERLEEILRQAEEAERRELVEQSQLSRITSNT